MTLALGGAMSGALSGCSNDAPESRACAETSCASNAPAIDFSGKSAVFTAHLRVLDSAGKALDKASVHVDKHAGTTDSDGRVTLKELDATSELSVSVSSKGSAPLLLKTDAFRSGQRTETLTLAPLSFDEEVNLKNRVTVQKDWGRIELSPSSIGDEEGSRVSKARLEIANLASTKVARDEAAISFKSVDRHNAPVLLKNVEAMVYVRLSSSTGEPLNLAPTKVANLALKLPRESKTKAGDELGLWALDEKSATLREESRCIVDLDGEERVCKGHVPHFSVWAVASAQDDEAAQCVRASVALPEDSCFKIEVERIWVERCDARGEHCEEARPHAQKLIASGAATPDSCQVWSAADTLRASVLYEVDAKGCSASDAPKSGRRVKRGDAQKVSAGSARDLLARWSADASATCKAECATLSLRIEREDVSDELWLDRDDDGFYTGKGALNPDCNDADPDAFPGAPEPFCEARDLDCDGQAGSKPDDATWNAECALCKAEARPEEPGNLRDENCDGKIEDRDGDGFSEPEDCDDFDAESAPDKREVAGNQIDEDCDGIAVDWDGDGAPSSAHLYLAAALKLPESAFTDCDDFDADTHPGLSAAREAGALSAYFEGRERSASYCELFDDQGRPSAAFYALALDRNCDGKVTDLDGDGFASPGDLALGAEQATDCDDFDPRVHAPAASGGACVPADALNQSMCKAAPRASTCPMLQVAGGVVQTTCEEALDRGQGTGQGVCAFLGWSEGDPLTLEPGRLWGPCDGDGPLADCPNGAQCGGPLPYSSAVNDYLRQRAGQSLSFQGMCFPKCKL